MKTEPQYVPAPPEEPEPESQPVVQAPSPVPPPSPTARVVTVKEAPPSPVPNVKNQVEDHQDVEKAAVVLQSAFRGLKARRLVEQEKRQSESSLPTMETQPSKIKEEDVKPAETPTKKVSFQPAASKWKSVGEKVISERRDSIKKKVCNAVNVATNISQNKIADKFSRLSKRLSMKRKPSSRRKSVGKSPSTRRSRRIAPTFNGTFGSDSLILIYNRRR